MYYESTEDVDGFQLGSPPPVVFIVLMDVSNYVRVVSR